MLRSLNAATLLAMAGMRAVATAGAGFGFEHDPYLGTPNYAVNMDEEDGEDIELEGHLGPVDPKELATLAKKTASDISYDAAEYAVSRPVVTEAKDNKVKSNKVMNYKAKNRKGKSKEEKSVKKSENSPAEQTLGPADIDCGGKRPPLTPGYKVHEYRSRAIKNAIAKTCRMSYWIGYHMFGLVDQSRPWWYFLALPVFIQPVSGHVIERNTVLDITSWATEKIGISMLAGLLCFVVTYGGRRLVGHKVKWFTLQLTVFFLVSLVALDLDSRAHGGIYYFITNIIIGFAVASIVLLLTPSVKVIGLVPNPHGLAGIRGQSEIHDIQSCASGFRWVKFQLKPMFNCSIFDVERVTYKWSATVLHISAHGSEHGIGPYFQRAHDQAPAEINSRILASKLVGKGLELIVLNACWSANYAQTVADITKAQVIGWHGPVRDSAAVIFTGYFYPLLADGTSYGAAFERALTAIQLDNSYSNQHAELFSPQT